MLIRNGIFHCGLGWVWWGLWRTPVCAPLCIDMWSVHVQEVINTGFFHMKSTCRRCHGQGKIIGTPCRKCGGRGTTTRSQTINVQIPAGVEDGQTMRVPVGSSEAYVVLNVSCNSKQ